MCKEWTNFNLFLRNMKLMIILLFFAFIPGSFGDSEENLGKSEGKSSSRERSKSSIAELGKLSAGGQSEISSFADQIPGVTKPLTQEEKQMLNKAADVGLDAVKNIGRSLQCTRKCPKQTSRTRQDQSNFQYDSKMGARTFTEALTNFPDLTNTDLKAADPMKLNDDRCKTAECQACASEIIDRLERTGHRNFRYWAWLRKRMLTIPKGQNKAKCTRLAINDDEVVQTNEMIMNANKIKKVVNDIQKKMKRGSTEVDKEKPEGAVSFSSRVRSLRNRNIGKATLRILRRRSKRTKRQTNGRGKGQVLQIGCVKKGQPAKGSGSWVHLCTQCWTWRVFSNKYKPKILNELTCHSENKCLSGFGQCQTSYKTVSVMERLGSYKNPKWEPKNLDIGSCCDCKVQENTALHGLVLN